MNIYTIQIGKWRKAKALGFEVLNTTVMNGDSRLSPSWDLLRAWQKNEVTEEEYRTEYFWLMRESFKANREFWLELAGKETLVLGCYCAPGCFCHRLELVEILTKFLKSLGKEVKYCGEIE